jgi:hypothetical protein
MNKLSGMTVNERFYEVDLSDEWDSAKERGDRETIIKLLGRVELADQAAEIADSVLDGKK